MFCPLLVAAARQLRILKLQEDVAKIFGEGLPQQTANVFRFPGSATVSVAPVGVSPTGLLSTNRIGMEYLYCFPSTASIRRRINHRLCRRAVNERQAGGGNSSV